MDSIGIRRGIVIDNRDPESRGRCKIFIPGLYPEKFSKTPENLPWAEPAMSLFGGGWTAEENSNFKETGVCSVPHMGNKGDGAQVWVFFDSNDIRYPVYFAVAQTGPGWFSKHNNQHVIITDNVKITVDEYNNFKPVKTDDKTISKNLAQAVSKNDAEKMQKDLMSIGGINKMSELYEKSGGASNTFEFIKKAGGTNGLYGISKACSEGLSSLGKFISKAGGTTGFSSLLSNYSFTDMKNVLNGKTTGTAGQLKLEIEKQFGSVDAFNTEISQIGGVDGLESITGHFESIDEFSGALEDINGADGINAMAEMEDSLGGAESYKEWTDGFKDGANSIDDLIDGKTAEDRQKELEANAEKIENETITKSDTNVAESTHPAMSNVVREGVKTRVRVEIVAPKKEGGNNDIAIDLKIVGDVNMRVDGNFYKEVTGKTYETYHDDHYVNHMAGYSEVQNGDRYVQIDGTQTNVTTGLIDNICKGGVNQIISSRYSTKMTGAVYSLVSEMIEINALDKLDINSTEINMDSQGFTSISSLNGMSIVSRKRGMTILGDTVTVEGSKHLQLDSSKINIHGKARIDMQSDNSIRIVTEPLTGVGDSITIITNNLKTSAKTSFTLTSATLTTINFRGLLNYKFAGTVANYIDAVSVAANHSTSGLNGAVGIKNETVTGENNITITGANTISTGGIKTETVVGANVLVLEATNTETITGLSTINANGGLTEKVTGARTETVTGAKTETVTGLNTINSNGGLVEATIGAKVVTAGTISETSITSHLISAPTVTIDGLTYTSRYTTMVAGVNPMSGNPETVNVPVISP